jgi:predicted MFS family arabinose efflux permease
MTTSSDVDRTPWALCCLLFFGGTVAAAQVGRAIVSLPLMRDEMSMGIGVAGAILSVFATLGATFGIGGGAFVAWIGPRRALVMGMIALAIGNLCGATATGTAALLAARVVEGAGFFGVVLATPSLLSRLAAGDGGKTGAAHRIRLRLHSRTPSQIRSCSQPISRLFDEGV